MKRIILAFAAAAAFAGTTGACATDTRTISQFLSFCNQTRTACNLNLKDYLRASNDQGFICLPQDMSLDEAAYRELDWLRDKGADDKALQEGNAEDAQWAAINALWPCKKE